MKKVALLCLAFLLYLSVGVYAQKVVYSEPEKDDVRNMTFEIVGKVDGNILIYKNYRETHFICTYDDDMKLLTRVRLDYLPDRIFNTDFLQYSGFCYMIYQYQRRNIVYCMALQLDGKGAKMGNPVQLDTTEIGFAASNRIYSVISSEDKQKILVYKVNGKNEKSHFVTTLLYDKSLQLLHKSRFPVPVPARNTFLKDFVVDNDGDMMCLLEAGSAQNDNVNKLVMLVKHAMTDAFALYDLKTNGLYLDEITVKADNFNKHYLITSFFSKQRRGNVDGLYSCLWDKKAGKEISSGGATFTDELRSDARGESSIKMAFNDYFIRQVIMKKDGGFIITAESYYTTTRGTVSSRWDYLYGGMQMDYYSYASPYYYPFSRNNMFSNNITRYFADNISVLSYDMNTKLEWSNVIRKSQYDDNTDNYIGYGLMNTGDQVHFLFNVQEKREMILSDQSISPDGQVTRSPTFKNLDKGYDFMPKEGKQVGSRQWVVPCQYRNYVCFSRIEF